ncbi:hypothetical protein LOTGIDRAFT_229960 [Lottia gigantea]|uniref:Cation-dependent mannose-6-phosphate receptor n=1 Tax=Lottia gigantea TaxID=225164 RepID=V4CQX8_LOTGI|nr:hypothetical protein LOTGIDRAFT_229960 [Lottia gigantea]ESP04870.1 hypothetical protein LOTGIDRAFT_229960 [Lottia gigantea]
MSIMIKFCMILGTFALAKSISAQLCVQTDSCTCRFDDGKASAKLGIEDGLINLHKIADDGEPVLFDDDKGKIYYYTPCSTYPCTSKTNSALCLAHEQDLGDLNQVKFFTNRSSSLEKPQVSIIYHVANSNITSQVDLKCKDITEFKFEKMINSTAYLFSLTSPCACIDGCLNGHSISTGSILVLLSFSAFIIYFGVGCLYRNVVLGATGQEVIPNHLFWASLPGLIKDGYLFFLSPCLGDRASERVYERL